MKTASLGAAALATATFLLLAAPTLARADSPPPAPPASAAASVAPPASAAASVAPPASSPAVTGPFVSSWGSCAIDAGRPFCWGVDHAMFGNAGGGETPTLVPAVTGIVTLSVGDAHGCGLDAKGTVMCWGSRYGEEGDIARGFKTPAGLPAAKSIFVSQYHRCLVSTSKEVWCWGDNAYAQSDGQSTERLRAPARVAGLSSVAEVALGQVSSCARTEAGKVSCWGRMKYAESPKLDELKLRAIAVPASARIDMGRDLACSLAKTGELHCWGDEASSFTADENRDSSKPVLLAPPGKVLDIAVASGSVCVRGDDGNVSCAGYFADMLAHAQQPPGTFVRVPGTAGAAWLDAGGTVACVRTGAGKIGCFGERWQVGVSYPEVATVPVPVLHLSGVTAIDSEESRTCAVTTSGEVHCWGATTDLAEPVQVSGLAKVTRVSVGPNGSCALQADKKVLCFTESSAAPAPGKPWVWGRGNSTGQVPVGADVLDVAVHGQHGCAIKTDGKLSCWGTNYWGILGAPQTEEYPKAEPPHDLAGLTQIARVVVARNRTCVVSTSGQTSCFGQGEGGLLGDGRVKDSPSPRAVKNLGSVASLSLGERLSCALLADSTAACWGNGALTPVPWQGLTDLVDIAAGRDSACVVRKSGEVLCGLPGNAKLVPGITDATRVSAGLRHACALRATGGVVCWGERRYGALGDGISDFLTTAVSVSLPASPPTRN